MPDFFNIAMINFKLPSLQTLKQFPINIQASLWYMQRTKGYYYMLILFRQDNKFHLCVIANKILIAYVCSN